MKFLTPEEVARLLGVTRRTVYTWLRVGKLPAIRLGHCWRVQESDILKLKPLDR